MVEKKPLTPSQIGQKLVTIFDELLTTGDWENSLFLRASASRLKELRSQAQQLSEAKEEGSEIGEFDFSQHKPLESGFVRVFVTIYQVEGANLQNWLNVIKALHEHSVTRPVYRKEEHAQKFVRSKMDIGRHGYVIVNIREDSIYQLGKGPVVDAFGNELLSLKEKAIRLENIVGFIHANKKRYSLRDSELIYEGEVEI